MKSWHQISLPTKTLTGQLLLGVGGGIAAYKICSLVSTWAKQEDPIRVVMTEAAKEFVTPLALSTLARHPVYTDRDFWQSTHHRPLHIDLGEWASVLVLAPLTANTLGKLAHGLADNLLTNIILASAAPVLLVPAMNTVMWEQKSVQRNVELLLRDPRYHLLPPAAGRLACDTVGTGRMAEPEEILVYTQSLFWTQGKRDLVGKHVLISAGSTREPLDPVRFIANPATGKMGLALARAAFHRGAQVKLVHGPMTESIPEYITSYPVTTGAEMSTTLTKHFPWCDLLYMNAAVGDIRPIETYPHKLAKQDIPALLPIESVPDILQHLTLQKSAYQYIVGFAAQTGDGRQAARAKLEQKNLDAIFVNPVDQPGSGFGTTTNQGYLMLRSGQELAFANAPKLALAHFLLDNQV
jgi:phosphopantothenoylcysteine decarboxylase / phosphopantothenate---cysteine ligase